MTETKQSSTKSGFTADERAAMKARAKEMKANASREEALQGVVDAIAEMEGPDRSIAEPLHELVMGGDYGLAAKTWYGMPAYVGADGKAVVFFQAAAKFKARYATIGFNDSAKLDDGDLWPTAFGVVAWNDSVAKRVTELLDRAV
ncbi:MAG TPA: hypothetical protein VNJ54_04745 [Plantibacter sp.]|uniref:hypothetical protein n=1 Tax=unclassified Plantibacter TaxID=2624265 RepID=UPI002B5586C2|nr:hypothetical protein [Plantibacter sp.]